MVAWQESQKRPAENELFINELKSIVEGYLESEKKIKIVPTDLDTYTLYSVGKNTMGIRLETYNSYLIALHYALNVIDTQE